MSDAQRPQPPKKDVALALLEESSMFVHLDPRRPNVLVPKGFLSQHQLVLQVGLNMAIPIPDLAVDEVGISCTLSFNRAPFWCRIPWTAIYALVSDDGRGGVWPEDVPPEIQQQQQKAGAPKPAPGKRQKPKLAAVVGGVGAAEKEEAPERGRSGASIKADDGLARSSGDGDAADGAEEPKQAPPPRIGLAAVPPPSRSQSGKSSPSEPSEAEPTDDAAPSPIAKAPPGKKPKREIPPYLRVIK